MKKILVFSIILIISITTINIKQVFAKDAGVSSIFSGGDDFIGAGGDEKKDKKNKKLDEKKLIQFSNLISNILIGIGAAIAVIYSVILGIKYMFGAMEEKAEIKESIIPFVIGCMVLFGAFAIWKIVVNVGNKI